MDTTANAVSPGLTLITPSELVYVSQCCVVIAVRKDFLCHIDSKLRKRDCGDMAVVMHITIYNYVIKSA